MSSLYFVEDGHVVPVLALESTVRPVDLVSVCLTGDAQHLQPGQIRQRHTQQGRSPNLGDVSFTQGLPDRPALKGSGAAWHTLSSLAGAGLGVKARLPNCLVGACILVFRFILPAIQALRSTVPVDQSSGHDR